MMSGLHNVFISYVEEDGDACRIVADGLEAAGFTTWYYQRDSLPGPTYLEQVRESIVGADAIVVLISPRALPSRQMSMELNQALEMDKPFVPLLRGLAHEEFRQRNPNWAMIVGAAASVAIPDDPQRVLPRLVEGLRRLGITPARGASRGAKIPSPPHDEGSNDTVSLLGRVRYAELVTRPEALVGAMIGGFRIVAYLGRGGSGYAYRARHAVRGDDACMKVLYPLAAPLNGLYRSIRTSVRALAQIDSPSIVKVFDCGPVTLVDGSSFFLVMELVNGTPLQDWCPVAADARVALRQRLSLADALMAAVANAHACRYFDDNGFERVGLLHGDIKPNNVVVRSNGTPVLLDFMIVDVQRALDPQYRDRVHVDRAHMTARYGTPLFMPPEQMQDGRVTSQSDIFSLGRTLNTVWPKNGLWQQEPTLEMAWTELIRWMTQMSPADRPSSVEVARARLHEIVAKLEDNAVSFLPPKNDVSTSRSATWRSDPVRLDSRPLLGDRGAVWSQLYVPDEPVYDFIGRAYNRIARVVPAHTYGERWILVDRVTGMVLRITEGVARSMDDDRTIFDAGIRGGQHLAIVDPATVR